MKIRPLDDRLVVKLVSPKGETRGGIIIPDTAKEKPQIGEVIAVGNDEELQKRIRVGDKVLFGKFVGTEVKVDGETQLVLNRSDVLAIVEE